MPGLRIGWLSLSRLQCLWSVWPLGEAARDLELGLMMGSLIGDNIVRNILASDRPCMP